MNLSSTKRSAAAPVILRDAARGCWLRFVRPREFVTARTLADVAAGLRRVEEAVAREGLYAAGFVSYEAAPAFDSSLVVNDDGGFPLLWFGLYEGIEGFELPAFALGENTSELDWQATVGHAEFNRHMARIKALIRSGDTYQVNYTYRLRAPFPAAATNPLAPRRRSGERVRERGNPISSSLNLQTPLPSPLPARPSQGEGAGQSVRAVSAAPVPSDPWDLFLQLVAAQDPPYGAFLDTGEWVICSASPELFFRLHGSHIECRPMKGTAARGRTQAEDLAQARGLQASEKERAENVMIVDMVRHDLGRVAQIGSVKVDRLCGVERYPTIWQMTSTIEAQTEAGLGDIFRALFPAASITGAPKVRTTQIIAELERLPRRLYTGTIGFLAPGRRAQFNVAIRTVLVNRPTGCAEYGVGSGITWDSDPEAEWQECRAKARILAPPVPAFSLLETLRWTPQEGYYLLERHLERLQDSALYFGFRFDLTALRLELERLAAGLGRARRRIRLLVTKEGCITLEGNTLPRATVKPPRITLARAPVDSSDPFLYHKTTHRAVYEAARVACPGFDDVLLFNEQGEITESTIANVTVDIAGQLYTPPVFCGLLPGTLRAHLLQQGELIERPITREELLRSPRVFLLNSVRGMYPVQVLKETAR